MTSLFDSCSSDSDSDSDSNETTPHPVIRALLSSLLKRIAPVTCQDLVLINKSLLSNNLKQITQRTTVQDDWISPELISLTQDTTTAAWNSIAQHSSIKETYLLSVLISIGTNSALNNIPQAFVQLDRAFVLGGPKRELRAILRILSMQRSKTQKKEKEEQQQQQQEKKEQENPTKSAIPISSSQVLWQASISDMNLISSWYSNNANTTTSIRTISAHDTITPALFRTKYYSKELPVVIKHHLTKNWKAMTLWKNIQYWENNYGHRTIPIEIGRHNQKEAWNEEWCTIHTFLQTYIVPSNHRVEQYFMNCQQKKERKKQKNNYDNKDDDHASNIIDVDKIDRMSLPIPLKVGYIAQHTLIEQLPSLKKDFIPPHEYCTECNQGQGITRINCWFGTDGTVTPLHYDTYDNFLTQVIGYKYVRLYSSKETNKLYVNEGKSGSEDDEDVDDKNKGIKEKKTYEDQTKQSATRKTPMKQCNISPIDVENYDQKEYPLFGEAVYTDVILKPGDSLFIPEGCWHYVRSLSCSFSINFWF